MIVFSVQVRFTKLREGTTVRIHNSSGAYDMEVTTHTKWSGRVWKRDRDIFWRHHRFIKSHCEDWTPVKPDPLCTLTKTMGPGQ